MLLYFSCEFLFQHNRIIYFLSSSLYLNFVFSTCHYAIYSTLASAPFMILAHIARRNRFTLTSARPAINLFNHCLLLSKVSRTYTCTSSLQTHSTNREESMSFTNNNSSPWIQPEASQSHTGLVVFNSLTKSKIPFIPREGNYVSWYGCGPTVYDSSHIGHARNYVTFDIIRRIMEDYLNYDVNMVMNITDIDDKIILRSREEYLFRQFRSQATALSEQKFEGARASGQPISTDADWNALLAELGDGSKPALAVKDPKFPMHYEAARATFGAIAAARKHLAEGKSSQNEAELLIDASKDVLSPWLDSKYAYWEKDYFEDMDALNVRRPNVLTRVSEFVPEIVSFVERIISKGYAYESEGSVFFDVDAFDGHNGNFYAKIEPFSKNNTGLLTDGEGSLSLKLSGKRGLSDFALWKKSKDGEPKWPSPWGEGRPGWHIECSVMASEILGSHIDIHTGGIDLAFPHHDNEIAQSEACLGCPQWVNYFLHTGHYHVKGAKMSKSLKNFTTIKEALKNNSWRQLRILFLLCKWDAPSDYDKNVMIEPVSIDRTVDNFFTNTSALLREFRLREQGSDGKRHFLEPELELQEALKDTKARSQRAAGLAMRALQAIVARTNTYLHGVAQTLIRRSSRWLPYFRVFGLVMDGFNSRIGWGSSASESGAQGPAIANHDFRDSVREIALSGGDKGALLSLCDRIRDLDLPDLGIVIDDHGDGRALVKFADPEVIRRERAARQAEEDAKLAKKEAATRAAEEKRQKRLAEGRLAPADMFRTPEMCELYSDWRDNGIPSKDKAGEELPKSKVKKLEKAYSAQEKLHNEYLKSIGQ
ncbi:tRNA synthetases class I (C) catalytic domain-containing protein [Kickxella alabastrina]|uniref:tRNA synthetases class I (C) catalytic domain-containing protein n=1 Tax=Kickxella alabastrina TaxID=61397 RepID=UPI0022207C05|nr:tRNA synthetases class I (C) catalytic domain-containing protein [Kickxella alabastrina]KAI7833870.1 tRNA synthetases class I (C) catalytic domain-containing protein [Kickxella alabastrina]